MKKLTYVGGSETYFMDHNGETYARCEDSDIGTIWYPDMWMGQSEYEIEGNLELELENKFEEIMIERNQKSLVKEILRDDKSKELLKEILNLGMEIRQDQLNGSCDKSGNELLDEFIDEKLSKL